MKYTYEDYMQAIINLKCGRDQLKPDGNNCNICGDNDHQAWECHHNPLNREYETKIHWRCFHCDLVFENMEKAKEHFGTAKEDREYPACISKEETGAMAFDKWHMRLIKLSLRPGEKRPETHPLGSCFYRDIIRDKGVKEAMKKAWKKLEAENELL